MSRSVSYANGAFAIAYRDISSFGYRDEDEEGNKIENPEYNEVQGSFDWECWLDSLKEKAKHFFPSLTDCDKWVGREDHAILENRFCYMGVSEYCGLVSIWLVLKDNLCDYKDIQGIAENWAEQVKGKFYKNFGDLVKIGTFSNGESIYQRKGK
jgi:hypothetical protein